MGEKVGSTKSIFAGKPAGMRALGRARHIRKYNIKTDLK
jgi:hypothetical protein